MFPWLARFPSRWRIDTFTIHNVNGGYDIHGKTRHFRKFNACNVRDIGIYECNDGERNVNRGQLVCYGNTDFHSAGCFYYKSSRRLLTPVVSVLKFILVACRSSANVTRVREYFIKKKKSEVILFLYFSTYQVSKKSETSSFDLHISRRESEEQC